MKSRTPAGTQSIVRTFELLKALSTRRNIGWRLTDLAAHCKLNHSTTHRIMACLLAMRLVRQRAEDKRYVPGPMLFEYALATPAYFQFQAACEKNLARVAKKTGWVAFMYLRSDEESVCTNRVGTYPGRKSFNDIGSRLPLAGSALGIAMLCALPRAEQETLLAANWKALYSNAAHRRRAYREMWQRSKAAGMGINLGDVVPGIGSIGVAILNAAGSPVAAIGASGPLEGVGEKRLADIRQLLGDEAAIIMREQAALIGDIVV
jgi:DNA-binding IclR family transcriptional regulator